MATSRDAKQESLVPWPLAGRLPAGAGSGAQRQRHLPPARNRESTHGGDPSPRRRKHPGRRRYRRAPPRRRPADNAKEESPVPWPLSSGVIRRGARQPCAERIKTPPRRAVSTARAEEVPTVRAGTAGSKPWPRRCPPATRSAARIKAKSCEACAHIDPTVVTA